MCDFFSCISDGRGHVKYFDWSIRKQILEGKLDYEHDSHSSIAGYFKVNEDKWNKFEYNPFTKDFKVDMINAHRDDSKAVEKFCNKLDFKTIIPQLTIKKLFHPFKDKNRKKVSKIDIDLLKKFVKVWNSVWDPVWASVGASVGASVRYSAWYSVWASVGASVWDSVRDSVWDSVGGSVWDSVGASVRAYYSSLFDLKKWKCIQHKKGVNPFQPGIDLWHRGIVPSYDGKVWRLHGGKNAKILWKKDIKNEY